MKQENNILKYFNNELSEQEMAELKHSDEFKTLSKIAHYSSYFETPNIDAEKALLEFKENYSTKKEVKVRTLYFSRLFKVAAVAVIMLCASYFVFFNNEKSFETRIAQTKSLILPDNSEVILNSSSLLSYNKKEWDEKRDIVLDGEAFFKVSKGQKFTVHTDAGNVQVLGTQFNVKERSDYFEVQCYEGIVAVTYGNQKVVLTKGKAFRIINGISQDITGFNANKPSWLNDESSFVQVPLSEVIEELERQYNIKIQSDNIDLTQLFTGTFTHKDKNIALQSVTIPLQLSYKIDKNTVIFYEYDEK
jgi:ferric-dicitrate binding protein FerR (iron transport regulator)